MNNYWLDKKEKALYEENISVCESQMSELENLRIQNASLQERLDTIEAEYNAIMEEGYEEAYQIICDLRGKLKDQSQLELKLYNDYEARLAEMKEFMIYQVDQYLQYATDEYKAAGISSVDISRGMTAAEIVDAAIQG